MSDHVEVEESGPDRRSVMKAAALVVVPVAGVGAVAACSSSSSSSSSGGSSSGNGNGTVAVPSSSVPVGGGYIDKSNNVVVTQPQAGVFKAFTAVCTHQGCTVGGVTNNRIVCPCHGSVFSAQDGSVLNGPAASPLAAMTAKVNGANVDVTGSSS
ncbi:Rieske (2Fe-2S) protein [Catenulispora rubra]|uniref:Rieske (2Fe-2S) protein n=1 Tax=Catenulispora rubra TaxID=280293 RepID=UPI001892529D|nr:Rieske (2Fe-2S) protein [Catenulispora rubra]